MSELWTVRWLKDNENPLQHLLGEVEVGWSRKIEGGWEREEGLIQILLNHWLIRKLLRIYDCLNIKKLNFKNHGMLHVLNVQIYFIRKQK